MAFLPRDRTAVFGAILLTGGLSAGPAGRQSEPAPKPAVNQTAAQMHADFQRRVEAYEGLHKKLGASLPKLPKNATLQEVDRDQRAMEQLIIRARVESKPGDIFTPGMQVFVRTVLAEASKGARGAQAKSSIVDESNPVEPAINQRYPDEVPLSTMPPRMLASLPKIPDEIEYRFVNADLILMDVRAHVILDFVLNALPILQRIAPR